MAKANDLVWKEINPASLPEDVAALYEAYKVQYRAMKEARQAFEQAINDACGTFQGKRIVCGYNFGKLSIALADDDRKSAKAPQGSLADFLAAQQASGRRA